MTYLKMTYLVRLTDGTTFLAERNKAYSYPNCFVFTNLQGNHAPSMSQKDKLIVPISSILYMIEQKGGDAKR